MDTYDAIMLLSYGGPNGPDDVLPFMRNATRGRGIPDERLLQVAAHYKRFGGVSPINACNQRLIADLSAELGRRGHDIPVGWGNRNWHPFVAEGLDELAGAGARRILVLPTSAYASYSGCRQYREDLAEAAAALREKWGTIVLGAEDSAGNPDADIILDKVRPYYSTPGMASAQVASVRRAWEALVARGVDADGIRLIFVTHSIPVSMEAGSSPFPFRPLIDEAVAASGGRAEQQGSEASSHAGTPATEVSYVAQHHALIQAIMPELRRVLGRADLGYDLVYCSRSGPPQACWLEPDINDFLKEIAGDAASDATAPSGVVVVPIGFICDHMEVVYDLDTEAKETAARLGIPYERADTVSTDPDFVSSLVDVLEERAAQARGENPARVTVTGTGPFHTVCSSDCCLSPTRSGHPAPTAGGAHPGAVHAPHSFGAPARAAGQPATTQEDSMSTPHPHAVVPPEQNPANPGHPAGVPDRVGEHAARHQARHAGTEATPHSHAAHARVTDPRDATDVDFDEVNNKQHYALYSVFALGDSLPADDGERGRIIAESLDYVTGAGAEIRSFYDVSGFRAEADLMVCGGSTMIPRSCRTLTTACVPARSVSSWIPCGPAWACTPPPSSTSATFPPASAASPPATGRWSTPSCAPTTGISRPPKSAPASWPNTAATVSRSTRTSRVRPCPPSASPTTSGCSRSRQTAWTAWRASCTPSATPRRVSTCARTPRSSRARA